MERSKLCPRKELEPFNLKLIKKFDVGKIKKYIENFNDEWSIYTDRQNMLYKERTNPHLYTNTYIIQDHPLSWIFGSKINTTKKDDEIIQYLSEIIYELQEMVNGKAARILLIRLQAKKNVALHVDGGDYLSTVRRFHIPIITNDKVFYNVNGDSVNMKEGECWEINNFKPHSVNNDSEKDRIHLLIDILPEYSFRNINNLNKDCKIKVIDDFVDPEDAKIFIDYINKNHLDSNKFPPTRGVVEFGRIRYEANIPETVPLENHKDNIDLIKKYSDKTLKAFKEYFNDQSLCISAFWMTMLGENTKLPYHQDNHYKAEHLNRSAVMYLNDDFEGGHLKFKDYDLTYKPKKYSIVMFPSDYVHMITPVKEGVRYALPIWGSNNLIYNIFEKNSPIISNPDHYKEFKK
jgi:hypothetical protein